MNSLTLEKAHILENFPSTDSEYIGSCEAGDVFLQRTAGGASGQEMELQLYEIAGMHLQRLCVVPHNSKAVVCGELVLWWASGQLFLVDVTTAAVRRLYETDRVVLSAVIVGDSVCVLLDSGLFVVLSSAESGFSVSQTLELSERPTLESAQMRANAFGTQVVLSAQFAGKTLLVTLDRVGSFDPTHPRDLMLKKEQTKRAFQMPEEGAFVITCSRIQGCRVNVLGYQREGCVLAQRFRGSAEMVEKVGEQTRFETAADAAWRPSPYTSGPEEREHWLSLYGLEEDCQCLPDKTRLVDGDFLWLLEPWVLKDPHELVPLALPELISVSAFAVCPEVLCVHFPGSVQIYQQWGRVWSLAEEFCSLEKAFASLVGPSALRICGQRFTTALEIKYSIQIAQTQTDLLCRPQDRAVVFCDLSQGRTVYPYYDGSVLFTGPVQFAQGAEDSLILSVSEEKFLAFRARALPEGENNRETDKTDKTLSPFEEQALIDKQNKLEEALVTKAVLHADIEDGYDQIGEEVEDLFRNDYFCPYDPTHEVEREQEIALPSAFIPLGLISKNLICFDVSQRRLAVLSYAPKDKSFSVCSTTVQSLEEWHSVGETLTLRGSGESITFGPTVTAPLWNHGRGQTAAVYVVQGSQGLVVSCPAAPQSQLCLPDLDSFLACGNIFYTIRGSELAAYSVSRPQTPLIKYQIEPSMHLVWAHGIKVVLASRLHFLETRRVSSVSQLAVEEMLPAALQNEEQFKIMAELLYASRAPVSSLLAKLPIAGFTDSIAKLVAQVAKYLPSKLMDLECTTLSLLGTRSTQQTSLSTQLPPSLGFDPREALYFWGLVCIHLLGAQPPEIPARPATLQKEDAAVKAVEFTGVISQAIDAAKASGYQFSQANAVLFIKAMQLVVQHHCALVYGYLNRYARDEQITLGHAFIAPLFREQRDAFLKYAALFPLDGVLEAIIGPGATPDEVLAWAEFLAVPETEAAERAEKARVYHVASEDARLLLRLDAQIQCPRAPHVFYAPEPKTHYADLQLLPAIETLRSFISLESAPDLTPLHLEWLRPDPHLAVLRELWSQAQSRLILEAPLVSLARNRSESLSEFQDAALRALCAFRVVRLGDFSGELSSELQAIAKRSARSSCLPGYLTVTQHSLDALKLGWQLFLASTSVGEFARDAALLQDLAAEVLGDAAIESLETKVRKARESCLRYTEMKRKAMPEFDTETDPKLRTLRRELAEAEAGLEGLREGRRWLQREVEWAFAVLE